VSVDLVGMSCSNGKRMDLKPDSQWLSVIVLY